MIDSLKKYINVKSKTYFSPGRINIIGEHVDYLGGNVFPFAIDKGIYAVVNEIKKPVLSIKSLNIKNQYKTINLQSKSIKHLGWHRYVGAVIDLLLDQGHKFSSGLKIIIHSDLPFGAGLSSSAALEVLLLTIFNKHFKLKYTMLQIVKMAKKVENDYVGVKSGIMDQFAVGISKKGHALYLNTKNLKYEYVPIKNESYIFVVAESKVVRGLIESKYNERINETQIALKRLKNKFNIDYLCDLKVEDLGEIKTYLDHPVLYRRTKHAISEFDRTEKAKKYLKLNQMFNFAKCINETHKSLKEDYEVSCKEVDILVKIMLDNGAIASRMIGGGFGGCVVGLVENEKFQKFKENVQALYKEATNLDTDVFVVNASKGTSELMV